MVGIILAICIGAMLFLAQNSLGKAELTLANYLEFLSWDVAFEVSRSTKLPTSMAKCEENKDEISPYLSKIGATLDLLLTLRERKQIPQEMRDILMRDTVSVSIRFVYVLDASEVSSIEELGLKFAVLPNGEIAHSGTIYGAEVPWNKVYDLAKLEKVVRIESTWKPKIEQPINQGM
jgi:hypothetical protein